MNTSINLDEIAHFNQLAESWWDEKGPMRALHAMNPLRLSFIREQVVLGLGLDEARIDILGGLDVLDVGCGAGILSEPLARMGGNVTAIDPAEQNIAIAKQHAQGQGLTIDYRASSAEDLAACGAQFDLVVASEVIEHVDGQGEFVATLQRLLKPRGVLVMSTINRNPLSYLVAIVGAEYVVRLLPRGTHAYEKFVKPVEMQEMARACGLSRLALEGMIFNPLSFTWHRGGSRTEVNYIGSFQNAD